MKFPSGNTLQRWLLPILAVVAAAQIWALWAVNNKVATSTQHSLNTQQSEINSSGQQLQDQINALLLDVRGLQITVSTLRGSNSNEDAAITSLENQITALDGAISQLQASGGSSFPDGSTGGSSTPPPPTPTPKAHGHK